jgi:2-polyprenyl-3-methyl-5-hydroxy-6-metoxy-1,4-benzoquinol methylase
MSQVSPLVVGANARQMGRIPTAPLIAGYAKELGIDVSDYFTGMTDIDIYECERSGYRYFTPFSLTGREDLYHHLEKFDWNYKPEKWEYDQAAGLLAKDNSIRTVLDVGCGKGFFLAIAKRHHLVGTGLELNSSAASVAKSQGLDVRTEMIEDHARDNPGRYDAVVTFQVLEHIPTVRPFLEGCIEALRPGGTLIIGVPNNDGFLKHANAVLNAPPHHMGLWTRKSLESLAGIFPLKLRSVTTEPLAEIDWYLSVQERRFLPPVARKAYYKLGLSKAARRLVAASSPRIAGHTILTVYEKITPET